MTKVEKIDLYWVEPTPLTRSVEWASEFLNDLGGDYSISEAAKDQVTLKNKTACPGYCSQGNSTTKTCNDIERAICQAIKTFDSELTAGFIHCSRDKCSGCEMVIRDNS